jgi:hypothetical protein
MRYSVHQVQLKQKANQNMSADIPFPTSEQRFENRDVLHGDEIRKEAAIIGDLIEGARSLPQEPDSPESPSVRVMDVAGQATVIYATRLPAGDRVLYRARQFQDTGGWGLSAMRYDGERMVSLVSIHTKTPSSIIEAYTTADGKRTRMHGGVHEQAVKILDAISAVVPRAPAGQANDTPDTGGESTSDASTDGSLADLYAIEAPPAFSPQEIAASREQKPLEASKLTRSLLGGKAARDAALSRRYGGF